MNEPIFALDIGTQSVTGIVLEEKEGSFTVCDFYSSQHKERAMLDGQIQNVIQVSEIITEVKEALEQKHGPFKEVCVAAAGRSLKTIQTKVTVPIHGRSISTTEQVKHIELSAVQQAQFELANTSKSSFHDYHCVGYSVVHYQLDGERIASLIDQTGEEVSVEVIATFLPKVVVESLMASLTRAQLEMKALTLEPIAAINVLVPASMRRLNVALIDIGAGTSDLALSRNGSITAYGMVPVAGDEITEKISDHYLLDFKKAEQLKQDVVNHKQARAQDILGFEVQVNYEELVSIIDDAVEDLAKLLAEKILMLNKESPQAVILIGGGSLTPKLEEKVARHLNLPTNRVAVRGSEAIHYVENKDEIPPGPDFVTPIGIAISATENPFEYMTVSVNEKKNFLFAMNELTVGDCLLQAGINLNHYYGKIGLAYFVNLNGEELTLPGSYGEEPSIFLNGREGSIDDLVHPNDSIQIIKGEDGRSPQVSIAELVGELKTIHCTYNGEKIAIEPICRVNNKAASLDYIVQDNDHIVAKQITTIEEFFRQTDLANMQEMDYPVYIDGQLLNIPGIENKIFVNGEVAGKDTPIHDGVEIELTPAETITVKELMQLLDKEIYHQIHITFNHKPLTLKQQLIYVLREGAILNNQDRIRRKDRLTLKQKAMRDFIFQDVFRYIQFDTSSITSDYQLLRNDEEVGFHAKIKSGDNLAIRLK